MDKIQLAGIGVFSLGFLFILSYLFYKFFLKAPGLPEIIQAGLVLIFLGIVVVLISLVIERVKELKK